MKKNNKLNKYLSFSLKDWLIFLLTMGAASALCYAIHRTTTSDVHVPMIFVLAVLVISLLTEGFFYGILAALTSVFGVNWAFTYPYWKLDFSIYGYPLTFFTMLAVGIASSMLASTMKLQQQLKLENEKEKTRFTLLRAVSHDLRTPLTAISGSISAVLDNSANLSEKDCRELLDNARNDADWLSRMVENLLTITRIDGDRETGIIKTDELLEEVVAECAHKFKIRYPDVKVDLSVPDTLMFVPMDAMLIEQVLINLMENSVIHGQTTDRISISAAEEGDFAVITVSDNGQGIDPNLIGRLFDAGFADAQGDSNKFMGIGLEVCKTIVNAHGGAISAANLPGAGAEFRFTLPKGGYDDTQG